MSFSAGVLLRITLSLWFRRETGESYKQYLPLPFKRGKGGTGALWGRFCPIFAESDSRIGLWRDYGFCF